MPWWSWLLLVWCALAVPAGAFVAAALQVAERKDWARRGGVDRRSRPRNAMGTAA
jgi:hypothetical protein